MKKELASSGRVTSSGTGDGSIFGSHNLMVEIMKVLAEVDNQDGIITKFDLIIDYITNNNVKRIELEHLEDSDDGTSVSISKQGIDHLAAVSEMIKFIRGYSHINTLSTIEMKDFIDKVMLRLCQIFPKDEISAEFGYDGYHLLNGDTVTPSQLNRLFIKYGIMFRINATGPKTWSVEECGRK